MTAPPGRPQDVLMPPARAAIFLVVTVREGAESVVRDFLPDVAGIVRAVGFRAPEAGLPAWSGIGAALWDRLFGGPRPAGLHPFRELAGATATAPCPPPVTCCSTCGRGVWTCASNWPRS